MLLRLAGVKHVSDDLLGKLLVRSLRATRNRESLCVMRMIRRILTLLSFVTYIRTRRKLREEPLASGGILDSMVGGQHQLDMHSRQRRPLNF
jgi:hypothetical protein